MSREDILPMVCRIFTRPISPCLGGPLPGRSARASVRFLRLGVKGTAPITKPLLFGMVNAAP